MPLVVYKKKPCFWSQDLLSYKCRCFNLWDNDSLLFVSFWDELCYWLWWNMLLLCWASKQSPWEWQ
jgi:hypothetical protein